MLLGILCSNLIVCSLDRFPAVWKQITTDGLTVSSDRIQRMRLQGAWFMPFSAAKSAELLRENLVRLGWKNSIRQENDGQILLFAQRGAFSRTGVYVVHGSILIIVLGALVGSLTGFKGTVVIPVADQTEKIFVAGGNSTIDLGFTVRCDFFDIELYPDGTVKNYRSGLTIIEDGQEVLRKTIAVNSPLTYRGIRFYQAGYEGFNVFMVELRSIESGQTFETTVPFQVEQQWRKEGLSFGIINAELQRQTVLRMKVWVAVRGVAPLALWFDDGESQTVMIGGKSYEMRLKQAYATGLQVSRDPGVRVVYLGFLLMIVGLLLSFFLSHRRIWFLLQGEGEGTRVLFAGGSNKNRSEFEKQFMALQKRLEGVCPGGA